MKIGIIDIGSNSVRLALMADGKTLYKTLQTTRLGEGLASSGKLSVAAIERTARAVSTFVQAAKADGAQEVYAFATAAARSASNGGDFVAAVKELCGVDIDVISGVTEAKIGILGALGYSDGGIIDLGGASCEVTVQSGGSTVYAKSVDVGAVRLLDTCGRDRAKLESYIKDKLSEYGSIDAGKYRMYGVSGTATTLAAVKHALKLYDPTVVHGTVLTRTEISAFADKFLSMSVEDIKKVDGMATWRADVIAGASLFLFRLMEYMNIDSFTVSENDNLEGYATLMGKNK